MSPEYDNNMKGVLFKNDKTKDTQPDATGTIVIDNVEYGISAWNNTSKGGKNYQSIKVTTKEEMAEFKKKKEDPISNPEKLDEEIPF